MFGSVGEVPGFRPPPILLYLHKAIRETVSNNTVHQPCQRWYLC